MHFSMSTKSSFILSLFATSLAAAETAQVVPQKTEAMAPGYNAPCRIEVQRPYDFFLSGSFTYWQPIQENMELGVVSNSSATFDLVNGKAVDLDFDYKPGFKVGFGMNFDHDKWDTFAEYTWFRATEHVRRELDVNNAAITLLPAWQIPNFLNPQYQAGSEKWRLRMDLVDWDLGRSCTVGTKLCLRPFIGLRGAFIRQNVEVDYLNVTPAALAIVPSTSVHQSSHSWGVGPRVGLSSNWKFGKGFRVYTKEEVDVLFTQYDLKSRQTSAVSVANQYIVKQDDANYLRAHVELDLGLGWESYFISDKYHIDFSADYGFQVFFDQNMFRSAASAQAVGKSVVPNGNLYIHGLTATARFDF
jgi:hypothetical protein